MKNNSNAIEQFCTTLESVSFTSQELMECAREGELSKIEETLEKQAELLDKINKLQDQFNEEDRKRIGEMLKLKELLRIIESNMSGFLTSVKQRKDATFQDLEDIQKRKSIGKYMVE